MSDLAFAVLVFCGILAALVPLAVWAGKVLAMEDGGPVPPIIVKPPKLNR